MKYDVFELTKKIVGQAEDQDDEIYVNIDGHHYFIMKKLEQTKWELSKPKKQKNKKGRKKGFENDIIKKVKQSGYNNSFDKNCIHDISVILNNNYKTSIMATDLKRIIVDVLKKHNISINNGRVNGYVKYFLVNGQLERQIKHPDVFNVVKTNLIPKKKEEFNLGILDALDMS